MPLASICHGYKASSIESQPLTELVLKHPFVVDAVTSLPTVTRIARLDAEAGHDPVPVTAIVVAFERELHKVADSQWRLFRPKFKDDISR